VLPALVLVCQVSDQNQQDKAWAARLWKVAKTSEQLRPDHWWSFELTSRAP